MQALQVPHVKLQNNHFTSDGQAGRQAYKQMDRQEDRQIDRWIDEQSHTDSISTCLQNIVGGGKV